MHRRREVCKKLTSIINKSNSKSIYLNRQILTNKNKKFLLKSIFL